VVTALAGKGRKVVSVHMGKDVVGVGANLGQAESVGPQEASMVDTATSGGRRDDWEESEVEESSVEYAVLENAGDFSWDTAYRWDPVFRSVYKHISNDGYEIKPNHTLTFNTTKRI